MAGTREGRIPLRDSYPSPAFEERLMSAAATTLPAAFPAVSIAQAHAMLTTAPASPFEIEEREIRGVKIKTWRNAPPTLAAVFELNKAFGSHTYLVHENERVTFEAHRRAVAHLAKRLIADGVKKGDRVAIIARNLPEWSVAFWAAALAGAIVAPLNAWLTGPSSNTASAIQARSLRSWTPSAGSACASTSTIAKI